MNKLPAFGLVERARALQPLIAREARTIDECDDMLTLQGLAILYDRNRPDAR